MILAGIDIGTNTLRILIADTGPTSFRQLYSDRVITRLGQGLDRSGALAPEAQERSITALVRFSNEIRLRSVVSTAAVGTSALRRASNASEFIRTVQSRTGIEIRVVDGTEEARLTLLGVRAALGPALDERHDAWLVIDVGGGSTEVVLARSQGEPVETSLSLGAVYLTERYLRHDPPRDGELRSLRMAVREQLGLIEEQFVSEHPAALIGTAGSVTTLAAMHLGMVEYDPGKINGLRMERKELDGLVALLAKTTLKERRALKGLERGREDIILAGAIVVQEIMEWSGSAGLLVSDWGLREGILLDRYERLKGYEA